MSDVQAEPESDRGRSHSCSAMIEESIGLSLALLLQTCGYLVVAYLLSRTRLFLPLMHVTVRLPHRIACYVIFSLFCIMVLRPPVERDIPQADGIRV
ncbi:hypothetical protein [Roseomonas mucosa]|uniref:hypothetical protein n=1 Tax=Roseomonas mucosa TaxID=207340 RepID=UPI003DA6EEFF